MLPSAVWSMPRFGTFNLHASLLPQYRGAAPIQWAIINGEKETGVTTFFLTHEIDTGRIIRREKLPIAETDDAGTLHDALMKTGAGLVTQTVDLILETNGRADTIAQETLYENAAALLRPAPKIFKDTCRIDWHQTTTAVYNFIRGLSPRPTAWTEFILSSGVRQPVKIFRTEKHYETHTLLPGTIRTEGKQTLEIATCDGFLRICTLQLSGKNRISAGEFLNGNRALRAD
jgi:methionyl-tRNA formyltransferase